MVLCECFKVVSLIDVVVVCVKFIMFDCEKGFLCVGVKNGGCVGMEYVMEYVEVLEVFDECVVDKGVEIVFELKVLLFLFGIEIDYEIIVLYFKFVFNNFNQIDVCGCGESVMIIFVKEVQI